MWSVELPRNNGTGRLMDLESGERNSSHNFRGPLRAVAEITPVPEVDLEPGNVVQLSQFPESHYPDAA